MHPYLDWTGPIAFAHRGGTSEHPENTVPAFRHAVELGYVYLETDVHATSDGVLVAFHDTDLSRTCGRPGTIGELPISEVAAALVDGREPIPRFEELLEEFPEARFNIDCKADSAVGPLVESIERLGCLDRICLGSFSDRRLRRLRRELGDGLCSSFGPAQVSSLVFTGRVPWGGQVAQVPVKAGPVTVVTERTVAAAHRRGLQVHVWTIDDHDEMHRLLDLGVDGIMTDHPARLKDVFSARGIWH